MITIVVPMAGRGSRFADAGYALPKPLIDVAGKPMITRVIDNLRCSRPHQFVFVVQREHLEIYALSRTLNEATESPIIVPIDGVTRGAAETVLAAEKHIPPGPLVIANSDQWVDFDMDLFYESLCDADGVILTMSSTDPKWSYIRRKNEVIVEVVEKKVVSNEATVGIYGYRKSSYFCEAATEMITRDDFSLGEFYVAPTYSYLARDGKIIKSMSIGSEADGMWGLGIPSDLEAFLNSTHASSLRA